MSQMKEQDKNPEKQPNDLGIGNFPGKKKKLRIKIAKMIQYLMKRIKAKVEKRQEMFNKDLEDLKNKER